MEWWLLERSRGRLDSVPDLMVIVMVVMMLIAFRMFGGMMGGRRGWLNAGHPYDQPTPDSALETLGERFARGEIDEQEYETKRKLLGRDSSGGGAR